MEYLDSPQCLSQPADDQDLYDSPYTEDMNYSMDQSEVNVNVDLVMNEMLVLSSKLYLMMSN